jgi:hypothetical protein
MSWWLQVLSRTADVSLGREAVACLRPVRRSCYFVPVPKSTKSCSERRVNDENCVRRKEG